MQTHNSEKQSLSLVKKLRKLRIHRGKIQNCEMKSHNYLYYFYPVAEMSFQIYLVFSGLIVRILSYFQHIFPVWDDNHRLGARHSFQSGSISALDSVIMCLCFINERSSIWDQAKARLACILVRFPAYYTGMKRSAFISIECTIGQISHLWGCISAFVM